MKFDTSATTNPIDQLKVIGHPHDRIEGRLKTTGAATYACEWKDVPPDMAYGFVLGAAIAKGRISSIDASRALATPGVLAVVTHENAGSSGKGEFYVQRFLAGPWVDNYHQAVAVVVATTFERARAAAQLVQVRYVEEKGSFDLAAQQASAPVAPKAQFGGPPETSVGDFDQAFAAAPFKLDETLYDAPPRPCHDGAACDHRIVGRRPTDLPHLHPTDELGPARPSRHARDPKGQHPPRLAVHRGRFRWKRNGAVGPRDGVPRRAGCRPAGQARAPARPDVQQHHPPPGDDPADPHRCDGRRQDHRHRS